MNGNTEIEFVILAKGHKVLYWDDIERQDNIAIAMLVIRYDDGWHTIGQWQKAWTDEIMPSRMPEHFVGELRGACRENPSDLLHRNANRCNERFSKIVKHYLNRGYTLMYQETPVK